GLLLAVLSGLSSSGTNEQLPYRVGLGLFFGVPVGLGVLGGGLFVSDLESKSTSGPGHIEPQRHWGQQIVLPLIVGFMGGVSIGFGSGLGIWLSGILGSNLGTWLSVGLSIGLGSGLGIWLSIGQVRRLTDILTAQWVGDTSA